MTDAPQDTGKEAEGLFDYIPQRLREGAPYGAWCPELVEGLAYRFPDAWVDTLDDAYDGANIAYVPWHYVAEWLDFWVGPGGWSVPAPDHWEVVDDGEKVDRKTGEVTPVHVRKFAMAVPVTILGVTRCNVGDEDSITDAYGSAAVNAWAQAFKRSAVLFGPTRYLYREKKNRRESGGSRRSRDAEVLTLDSECPFKKYRGATWARVFETEFGQPNNYIEYLLGWDQLKPKMREFLQREYDAWKERGGPPGAATPAGAPAPAANGNGNGGSNDTPVHPLLLEQPGKRLAGDIFNDLALELHGGKPDERMLGAYAWVHPNTGLLEDWTDRDWKVALSDFQKHGLRVFEAAVDRKAEREGKVGEPLVKARGLMERLAATGLSWDELKPLRTRLEAAAAGKVEETVAAVTVDVQQALLERMAAGPANG